MNNTNYNDSNIHSLFATPVYATKYKSDPKLEALLKQQPLHEKFLEKPSAENEMNQIKPLYGSHSKNLKILRLEECKELREFILHHAKILGNTVLGFDVENYTDVLSWVSIKSQNEQHIPHVHPNSFISGVYYFDSNVTPLTFIDTTKAPARSYSLLPRKNRKSQSTFSVESVTLDITQGDIVLFPSYLKHTVATNQTNGDRYSLAFNIVPSVSVGFDEDLTLFDFIDATQN